MRKIMLTVVATCAVVAFIPATALAHGHGGRHHHARIHHRQFGRAWGLAGNPTPASPTAAQDAGTVQSFTNGVLTIALANGQTVSGTVTPDTEIECRASDTSATPGWQSHDQGDDQGEDQGQGDDDNNENAQNCDTSALTAGTVVHEARMSVSGAGANWDKVELVTTAASATTSSSSSSSSSSCGHQ